MYLPLILMFAVSVLAKNSQINDVEEPSTDLPEKEQENLTKNKIGKFISDCSLPGTWVNRHGSEIILNVTEEGHVTGKYLTAVEATEGAAGEGHVPIFGQASPGDRHRTFGFTVSWNEGASTTSWTGQCFFCDGKEFLKTTWILTSEVTSCNKDWLANRVGQDEFTRKKM
ncbi:avidin-related protein 4/5-like [Antedon mediterranea]|uniref:avidin-related protein 4/5-like n=1 Tax=Antedon mediterranea TaxID=105859 RepID=UPI003AF5D040